jgi:hypothetical protein
MGQEVGGSAIEAPKIAGHRDVEMTAEYTFVAPERQNELTRRIQQKLAEARKNRTEPTIAVPPASPTQEDRLRLADTAPVTILLQ